MQVIALFVQSGINKSYKGLKWWAFGNAFLATGYILSYMRQIPGIEAFTIIGNNVTFTVGMILTYVGTLRFMNKKENVKFLAGFLLFITSISVYFTLFNNSLPERRINLAFSLGVLSLLIARALFLHKKKLYKNSAYFLSAVFFTYFILFVLRIIVTLTNGENEINVFESTIVQVVFYLFTLALGILSTFGFIIMVNQRLNAERSEDNENLSLIFDTSPDSVLITRLKDGVFVEVNEAFISKIGYSREEVIGKSTLEINIWSNLEDRERFINTLKNNEKCENMEFVFKKKDGSEMNGMISAKIISIQDELHIISVTHDITKRKKIEKELQESENKYKDLAHQLELERNYAVVNAMTDGLTRLGNRRQFDEALRREFFRLKRSGAKLSLMMMDIDYFKKYNDKYGHIAGDECLKKVAEVIRHTVGRAHDVVARYGGEEFVVIMPETDIEGALILAERIRKAVEESAILSFVSDVSNYITISIGVTTIATENVITPEKIIELADEALYCAKESGRNRVKFVDESVVKSKNEINNKSNLVKLVWSANDECGNITIDREHKKLFEDSNKLLAAVMRGRGKEECLVLMEGLLNDIVNHFKDEEEIMKYTSYPAVVEHSKIHKELVAKALDLYERYKEEKTNVGEVFSFLVYDVIAQHMLIEDKKFFPYVNVR